MRNSNSLTTLISGLVLIALITVSPATVNGQVWTLDSDNLTASAEAHTVDATQGVPPPDICNAGPDVKNSMIDRALHKDRGRQVWKLCKSNAYRCPLTGFAMAEI